jgi:hypothetical protein
MEIHLLHHKKMNIHFFLLCNEEWIGKAAGQCLTV